jgi:hypothetical protein
MEKNASLRWALPNMGTALVIGSLLALLGATVWLVVFGWTLPAQPIEISVGGYVALAFGVLFSLAVGWGLMALLFYSSRAGYDEPPHIVLKSELNDRQ